MKKTTIFLIALFFMSVSVFAQGELYHTYDYDAAGNRILRKTIEINQRVLKSDSTEATSEDSNQKSHYDEFVGKHVVNVFPNPTHGMLTLQFEQSVDNGYYQLFGLQGQLLAEGRITTTTILNLSQYQTGVYMLTIVLNDEKETWKIIKK